RAHTNAIRTGLPRRGDHRLVLKDAGNRQGGWIALGIGHSTYGHWVAMAIAKPGGMHASGWGRTVESRGGGSEFHGSNCAHTLAGVVAINGAGCPTLICCGAAIVIAPIDCWTAIQKGVGERKAAIILQRAEQWIDIHEVSCTSEAAGIVAV